MEEQVANLINEIHQIQSQYLDEVGPGGRKVWPKAIKSRALEVVRQIGSVTKAAKQMGLPKETLYVWRAKSRQSSKFKELTVRKEPVCATVTVAQNNKILVS